MHGQRLPETCAIFGRAAFDPVRRKQAAARWLLRVAGGLCAVALLAGCAGAAPQAEQPAAAPTAGAPTAGAPTAGAPGAAQPGEPGEPAVQPDARASATAAPAAADSAGAPDAAGVSALLRAAQPPAGRPTPESHAGAAGPARVTAMPSPAPSAAPTAGAPTAAAPTAAGTVAPATEPETPSVVLPTSTPHAPTRPMARAVASLNVRAGPGTMYAVIGGLEPGSRVEIVGRNPASDWWQVAYPNGSKGWVYAPLVEAEGSTNAIAVAADIPPPPAATLPPPLAQAPQATAIPTPITEETQPPAPAPDAPAPPPAGPDFRVVSKRLWDVYENGGQLFGDSVICGEKRQLVVVVLDAQGNRLNGVAVQAEYGAREIFVTGSQGKGDGAVEFVLGGGQDVKVIRDSDGRAVTSEMATGLSTMPAAIPFEDLIAARYCTDAASCQHFVDAPGCWGHYSWTVTFQRSY